METGIEYSNVKLQYGLREEKIVHISEIPPEERGEKCGCICPLCKRILQARLGTGIRTPHFAHSKENCDIEQAQETALHRLAKEILEENKYIRLPEYIVYHTDKDVYYEADVNDETREKQQETKTAVKETIYHFNRVVLEKRLDDILPDVLVWTEGKKRKLMIEVAVTHFIDKEKEAKILNQKMPCLEIDLSSLHKSDFNREALKKVLLDQTENKYWIYNTRHHKAAEEMSARNRKLVDEYKKNRERELQKIFKQEEESRVTKKIKLKNIEQSLRPEVYNHIVLNLRNDVAAERNLRKKNFYRDLEGKYPFYLDIPVTGQIAFNCDRRIWQMDLFNEFIYYRKNFTYISLKWIWSCFMNKNKKNSYLNWKLIAKDKFTLGKKDYEQNLALDAIKTYLQYLALLGFVDINDQFYYPKDYTIVNKTVVPPNLDYALIFQEIVSTLEDTPFIDSDILDSL